MDRQIAQLKAVKRNLTSNIDSDYMSVPILSTAKKSRALPAPTDATLPELGFGMGTLTLRDRNRDNIADLDEEWDLEDKGDESEDDESDDE